MFDFNLINSKIPDGEQLPELHGAAIAPHCWTLTIDSAACNNNGVSDSTPAEASATLLPCADYFHSETQKPQVGRFGGHDTYKIGQLGFISFADLAARCGRGSENICVTACECLRDLAQEPALAVSLVHGMRTLKDNKNDYLAIRNFKRPQKLARRIGASPFITLSGETK